MVFAPQARMRRRRPLNRRANALRNNDPDLR
jgi:hypothetical protein